MKKMHPFFRPIDEAVDMEVDCSVSTVQLTESRPQINPQTVCSVDEPDDVSMDSASITSDNMETSPIVSDEKISKIELDKENIAKSSESMVAYVSKTDTSFQDATTNSETPEITVDDHLARFSNTFVSGSQIASSNDSLQEKKEVESLNDHENTSSSSYSNPLSGFNLIRPAPVSFDMLGSVNCRSPLRVPFTGSLSSPFSASFRIPPRRVNTEELSLSLPGKSNLSFGRDKAFTKSLLMSFDTFRTNPPRALDLSEIVQPPTVSLTKISS